MTLPLTADPAAFSLRRAPPRVMRLSRKALAGLGAAACLSIGGALVYALRPAQKVAHLNLVDTDGRNRADTVTGAPKDYSQVPKLGPPMPGDLGRPILRAQQNGNPVPVPPISASLPPGSDPLVTQAQQAHQRAMQERESARASQLFLKNAASSKEDQQAIMPALLSSTDPLATAQAPSGKGSFLNGPADRTFVSAERIAPPISPNIVQAGSIIPAALLTGIQSDLPGQITAQVTQNVYDSPTGRVLLIPQGSRLVGAYDSDISAGQSRVLLAWDRLILPSGRSILLDRQPGADAAGRAGLHDGANYHWGNMLKAALVSSLLGIGTELAVGSDDALVRAVRTGTQDSISQTGRQVVQRELSVPPTLTVRPGHVLRVIVTRDLVLDPIMPGDRR
nr:TrbI/VirB10 family protein [Sphingobium sp. B11D3B]